MQARDGRDREGDRRHRKKLGDPEFRRRLEENKLRVKGAGVDLKSAEQDSKEVAMKAREAAKAKRVSKGKGLFDDSAVDDMSRQVASQPLLPQKATGMWNLDGKTNSEMGGDLSKERLASELEARGIAVKRQGQHTKHAGAVHPSEKVAALKHKLRESNNGSAIVPKLTDEDGVLKSSKVYNWRQGLPWETEVGDAAMSPPPARPQRPQRRRMETGEASTTQRRQTTRSPVTVKASTRMLPSARARPRARLPAALPKAASARVRPRARPHAPLPAAVPPPPPPPPLAYARPRARLCARQRARAPRQPPSRARGGASRLGRPRKLPRRLLPLLRRGLRRSSQSSQATTPSSRAELSCGSE